MNLLRYIVLTGISAAAKCATKRVKLDTGLQKKRGDGDDEESEADYGRELVSADPLTLRAFLLKSYYRDIDRTQHVRLILHLPSGVGKDDVQAEVIDGGYLLLVKVKVPKLILNIDRVHAKEIEKGDFKIGDSVILAGFKDDLAQVQPADGADVFQKMRIPLEIRAQPKICAKSIKEDKESGVRLLCVELKEEEAAFKTNTAPITQTEM